jgi:hypothetical protein
MRVMRVMGVMRMVTMKKESTSFVFLV